VRTTVTKATSRPRRRQRTLTQEQAGRKHGFRSGLEKRIAQELEALGVDFSFESVQIAFTQPAKHRTYTPDFILPNGIVIETKGRFLTADRQKHLMVRECNPDIDIRFVFQNPRARISKRSKTTYGMWCEKHGFQYAKGSIPREWIDE